MKLIEKNTDLINVFDNKINFIGVSSIIDIKKHIYEYMTDNFVWNAPYSAIIYSPSDVDIIYFDDYLSKYINDYEIKYEKDYVNKVISDETASIHFVSPVDTIELKVPEGYFDNCFFIFYDTFLNDEFFEACLKLTKRITFFTLNNEDSLINSLENQDDVYLFRPDEYFQRLDEIKAKNISLTEREYTEIVGF
jgi:hypothetical protein